MLKAKKVTTLKKESCELKTIRSKHIQIVIAVTKKQGKHAGIFLNQSITIPE